MYRFAIAALLVIVATPLHAQHTDADHAAHTRASGSAAGALPTVPGQSAHAAIGEIVRLLEADAATDWSRVNIGALREHLRDMDDVMLRAQVSSRNVDGGLQADVTGDGRVADAIRRMVVNHSAELDARDDLVAGTSMIPGGVRVTVTAGVPHDERTVAKIRALGVFGLLTLGDHHAPHHLALARGAEVHKH
jgi:hypothetical protein